MRFATLHPVPSFQRTLESMARPGALDQDGFQRSLE
jgi:hypothetical protein